MIMIRLLIHCFAIILFVLPVHARDIILEFKGAYFLPTHSSFRTIYHGNALYGPELTVQILNERNWYAFTSIDFLQTKGTVPGLCDTTKIQLLPLTIGIKYFVPLFSHRINFYLGLGLQPICARVKNFLPFIESTQSQWACGGTVKIGTYVHLPHRLVLDLFIDYSFAGMRCKQSSCVNALVFPKLSVNSALFGGGLGYRF